MRILGLRVGGAILLRRLEECGNRCVRFLTRVRGDRCNQRGHHVVHEGRPSLQEAEADERWGYRQAPLFDTVMRCFVLCCIALRYVALRSRCHEVRCFACHEVHHGDEVVRAIEDEGLGFRSAVEGFRNVQFWSGL